MYGRARAPQWLSELTLRHEPPWLPMGTRALRGAPIFHAEGPDVERLRERKRALLAAAHDEVSIELPNVEAPVREAAHFVARTTGRALKTDRPALDASRAVFPYSIIAGAQFVVNTARTWHVAGMKSRLLAGAPRGARRAELIQQ